MALCGTFGYELDPRKLTEEERELVRGQVADYHKYYDLLHYGDFYRLTSPTEDPYLCRWQFVSPDKKEVLFTQVIMRQPPAVCQFQKLPGLDPDAWYRDEATGAVYSGALLMHAGLNLSAETSSSTGTGPACPSTCGPGPVRVLPFPRFFGRNAHVFPEFPGKF